MKFSLVFGALCPTIRKQLTEAGIRVPAGKAEHWQRDADAICRLSLRRMLPESQVQAARKRLVKRIADELREFAEKQGAKRKKT